MSFVLEEVEHGQGSSVGRLAVGDYAVLWEHEQATVGQVRDALAPERQLAHTTVPPC